MSKENFQVAVKAIIFAKGRYLLLYKSENEDVSPMEWDIPGGRLKYGENPVEALNREVREETGIDITGKKIFSLKAWSIQKSKFQLIGIDFLCVLGSIQKFILCEEHLLAQWMRKEEILKNKNIPNWLKETVKLAEKIDFFEKN